MNFTMKKRELLGNPREKYGQTFLLGLAVAIAFFVPYILFDQGYFLFFGDFNVQQIPFYKLCHEAVRSGNIGWNWNTDLGANFVGSYSFYLLGSPFFWLTLPFPTDFVPYLMGPLLILKFACSGLTAYCYLRRFTRTPEAAQLGALLYAFSGFSVYNIFFNHFHEAIIFFPLLLWSVELLITENRRGFFACMVAVTAITNYFFFYGMVVFVVIYWFVRTLSHCYKQLPSRFLWFVLEAVLGLCLSAVIMLPTIMAVFGNSRLGEISVGWNGITYGKEQIYLNIWQCFFFPPDLPARPIFFPDADVKWSSLGGWLPLFSMVGVFAFMQQKKGNWLRRLLGILIFMAMVPILNSAFYMFNSAYYARWFYMPILMMCLATVLSVEDSKIRWRSAYKWVMGITLATVAVIGLFPREMEGGQIIKWGLYTEGDDTTYLMRFLATSAIAVVSLIILGLILKLIRKNRMQFIRCATAMVCILSVLYAAYFIGTGKSHSYSSDVMIGDLLESDLSLPGDADTYRIDVYEGVDNTAMFLGYSSINAFHSVVPTSITDFWEYVGEERGVGSRPSVKSYAARALLGVKYLLARDGGEKFTDDMGKPMMDGFTFYSKENGYTVYENTNYLPYGFTYDMYMTKEQCDTLTEYDRSNLMVKALLLNEEQIAKYGSRMKNVCDADLPAENAILDSADPDAVGTESAVPSSDMASAASKPATDLDTAPDNLPEQRISSVLDYSYTGDTLAEDTAKRRANAVSSFTRTKGGFESEITLENENLVFFSIPYDKGWTATVNGKPVDIEQVNVGFMAVAGQAGANTIVFTYKTPGLMLGLLITAVAAALFIIYFGVYLIRKAHGKIGYTEYPEGDALLEWYRCEVTNEKMLAAIAQQDEEQEQPEEPYADTPVGYSDPGFDRGFWIQPERAAPPEDENGQTPQDNDGEQ